MAAGVRRTADFKVDVWGQGQAPECSVCQEEVRSGAPVICHGMGGIQINARFPELNPVMFREVDCRNEGCFQSGEITFIL